MDLSKLPKFSQTRPGDAPQPLMDTSAPPPDPDRPTVIDYAARDGLQEHAASRRREDTRHDPGSSGGAGIDIWLSLIFGVIFLFMGINFGKFVLARMSGQQFYDYMGPGAGLIWPQGTAQAGQPVAYQDWIKFYYNTPPTASLNMKGIWDDAAYFLFGSALLLEAVFLFVVRTAAPFRIALLLFALLIAVSAAGFNLLVALMWFGRGQLPLMSLIAVAFGGWIVLSEWQILAAVWAQKNAPTAGKTIGAQGG
jgi:hypothetical protein